MIVLAAMICIMSSPICQTVEFRDIFEDFDSCSAFADDATARQAEIPADTLQLLRFKALSCRDERDS